MDRVQKAVVISLVATSALAWTAYINQPDMMVAMTTYNPLSISLFTASWTAGMAAMMFPAITPMVLMYNRLVINTKNTSDNQSSVTIQEEEHQQPNKSTSSFPSLRVIIFVGSYLLVWAVTGISLLLGWSIVMNSTIMTTGNSVLIQYLYGALLVIAGAYQFTPLKRICIGYCESPMSFFMRRWRDGISGAVNMGVYHGIYCLGCCWAYFLLMVALGWMNLLWMGLFAGMIFGEKIWSRGIWMARAAGIRVAITGVLVAAGMVPSIVSSYTSMTVSEDDRGNDMTMMMNDHVNNNNNDMTVSNSSPEPSMGTSDDGVASSGANAQSHGRASDHDGQTMESMDNDNGNGHTETMNME
jgi:predicted metal-binding membrane protein